jgi:hypothetical protein
VKTFRGRDGVGLNAVVYFDGKKAADCVDEGAGGEMRIHFFDQTHGESFFREEISAYINALNLPPAYTVDGPDGKVKIPYDIEHIVNVLVNELEELKKCKRVCKTKTLVRFADGKVSAFKIPFGPHIKSELLAKYGSKIVSFINEEIA